MSKKMNILAWEISGALPKFNAICLSYGVLPASIFKEPLRVGYKSDIRRITAYYLHKILHYDLTVTAGLLGRSRVSAARFVETFEERYDFDKEFRARCNSLNVKPRREGK